MFWLVDNEIGLLWALHHKKQRLCIFVAKRRSTQLYSTKNMFWFVMRQNWALSSQRLTLIFIWLPSKEGFSLSFAQLHFLQYYLSFEIVGTHFVLGTYFVVCWKSGGNRLLKNFTSMGCSARALWAQFQLLLLQQRVLYVKSASHTTQANLRMIVPKQLVE